MRVRPFALVAVSFGLLLGSCSAISGAFEAADNAEKSVKNEVLGDGPGTCCVNQQFFECPDAAATLGCAGEPFDLAKCTDACPMGDNNCPLQCFAKHGPDTSGCARAEARDGECPKG